MGDDENKPVVQPNQSSSNPPAPTENVNAVSIKTPVFSEASANGWFSILEAQFNIGRITSPQTKYYHALQGLPPSIVNNLPSEVLTAADYDLLKSNVISTFEETKAELFDKLASKSLMTGRPSLYLRVTKRG